jgi:hypothetical protein
MLHKNQGPVIDEARKNGFIFSSVFLTGSGSRNPVYAAARTGFSVYFDLIRNRKRGRKVFHFHLASFFKFMAENLSFTQFVT